MKFIGNIIWFVFGGLLIALQYVIASFLLFISIIGIPFALQTFKLAGLALWPFGKKIIPRENNSETISVLLNIIWFLVGGIWISVTHLLFGLFFFITIIGIPFGRQHFKLAGLALTPFGKKII